MGFYKIKQRILQQNLSEYYRFKSADTLCEQFNKFINTLKREKKEEMKGKYPWLYLNNKRKHMSDGEVLNKYVNLDRSCLTNEEKKQVLDMLYKYKDAFSLRDEIGTCPNIEVEIEVRDKSAFSIRSYHVKEEDIKEFR